MSSIFIQKIFPLYDDISNVDSYVDIACYNLGCLFQISCYLSINEYDWLCHSLQKLSVIWQFLETMA